MKQQLRLGAVNTWGLLQGLNRMFQKPRFKILAARGIRPVRNEQIAITPLLAS